ncbi:MAG: 16S rRNA (cytosine(1402)-N(4))-methyltransferase RsmH [Planctomycetota bacterium]|nr:16S rRNA (cytosine(1402)-N(4))-methyltransferase RsmH [Planctomycetota bacterium]MDP7252049.1 16S rRNA (cytosine(1402)-N(4))-methyltransferase RsmH [Planctomycetota bacterium]
MNEPILHHPVMLEEVLNFLEPAPGAVYVDATLGGASYSRAILEKTNGRATVVGLDRDLEAIEAASQRLSEYETFHAIHTEFSDLTNVLHSLGLEMIDGLVADLGVSSPQFDRPERGFSLRHDGDIDMRMDATQKTTAADIVNYEKQEELARILWEYGEERFSRRLARRIVDRRKTKKFTSTVELADFIAATIPGKRGHIHPATRTFQALRIATNNELAELECLCNQAEQTVKPSGVFICVSFHSLEDRLVKQAHRQRNQDGKPLWELLTRRPATPSADEKSVNPRSRSAKLRAARRLGP